VEAGELRPSDIRWRQQDLERRAQQAKFFERLLKLEQERRHLAADIADLCREAKDHGHDPAVLRRAVQLRLEDEEAKDRRLAVERGASQLLLDFPG
jgi:uncharacterized protein (UPF0335 family)